MMQGSCKCWSTRSQMLPGLGVGWRFLWPKDHKDMHKHRSRRVDGLVTLGFFECRVVDVLSSKNWQMPVSLCIRTEASCKMLPSHFHLIPKKHCLVNWSTAPKVEELRQNKSTLGRLPFQHQFSRCGWRCLATGAFTWSGKAVVHSGEFLRADFSGEHRTPSPSEEAEVATQVTSPSNAPDELKLF